MQLFNYNLGNGTIVGLLLIIVAASPFLYNIYLHPLSRYPGPKLWAATRISWAVSMQSGHLHHRLKEFHDRYGPVVRIAPNELSYIDAHAWKDIYGTKPGHKVIERNRTWNEPGKPWSIMAADEANHTRNRRTLMGAFTDYSVHEHAPILESIVQLMITKFKEAIDAGQGHAVVDVVQWLNFLTFDVAGALSFGESFDSVKNGKAHPWVDIACTFGKGLALMASINFFWPLNKLLRYAMPKDVMQKMEYHHQLSKEKVHQRLAAQDGNERQDFVGSIMRYNREKGEAVDIEELEVNMNILVFAGSETTSSAMAAILNALMRYPEALHKAENEVRHAFKGEEDITVASIAKLDYLTSVIKEGIRLGPPAVIGIPRVVPQGGEIICGHWVPGGTFLSVSQYPAFRSSTNFSHPDEFLPERFTDEKSIDNLSVFEPFLVGRHKCLGQKFAWAEMRLTLARLLYAFDMSPAEGHKLQDWGHQETVFFWEKEPLMICLRRGETE